MKRTISFFVVVTAIGIFAATAKADDVTDWNVIMFQLAKVAATSPLITTRVAAIVHASIYDALNGIERRYTPLHVAPAADPGASRRAAVVQAAYASLSKLYPAQQSTLDQKRAESLAGIASSDAAENSQSIARGIQWGQQVADAIWAWRLTDGFNTPFAPFFGPANPGPGVWRSTPPGNLPMAGRQFVDMMPWVIASPSQFLAPGPPALGSTQWAQDFNETKLMGQDNSPSRTADETFYSSFWASTSSSYLWDIAAVSLAAERHTTLSENSRLLALLNVTMADAAIGCWKSKWTYQFWRPITAITAVAPGSSDGNPGTMEIKDWNPFLVTPAHQDYPSGHSCVSGAAGAVLSNFFGEQSSFVMTSDGMAGARYFPSFTAATDEVKNARVFAGIHFRTACNDGVALGISTANYVAGKAFGPANGNAKGQISH